MFKISDRDAVLIAGIRWLKVLVVQHLKPHQGVDKKRR